MWSRRIRSLSAPSLAVFLLLPFGLSLMSCALGEKTSGPGAPVAPGTVEIVGTLVAVKDGRAYDAGVDLTLDTMLGKSELVRVPSAFIAGPRDSVMAMHAVVDRAKIGDRIRAHGTRDESGALVPDHLELISSPFKP